MYHLSFGDAMRLTINLFLNQNQNWKKLLKDICEKKIDFNFVSAELSFRFVFTHPLKTYKSYFV